MFLKLLSGVKYQGQGQSVRGFAKQIHTQMCLAALFDQRCKVENEWRKNQNEWDDDEHEQRRVFHEEELRVYKEKGRQLKCEVTGKNKRPGSLDCGCKDMCMVKKSETHLIYYEGGTGIIPKK